MGVKPQGKFGMDSLDLDAPVGIDNEFASSVGGYEMLQTRLYDTKRPAAVAYVK